MYALRADSSRTYPACHHTNSTLAIRQAVTRSESSVASGRSCCVAKLDRYISLEDRKQFLRQLARIAEFVPIIQLVHECRDPKDDKFLEVALNGKADLILTGDADLLAMNPWREIAILSPADYLREQKLLRP